MTKATLIEMLRDVPDDAEIIAFNGDESEAVPVTGALLWPAGMERPGQCRYTVGPGPDRSDWQTAFVVELQPDEP